MFCVLEVKDVIRIPPSKLGDNLESTVKRIINEEKVNRLNKDFGISLGVIDLKEIGEAKIKLGEGAPYVSVVYNMLSFKPELKIVYHGELVEVTEFGGFMEVGPFDGLVHVSQLMDDFINFDAKNFSFIGKETNNILSKGDDIYARLVSVSLKENITQSKLGLTMRQSGLGKLEWIEKDNKKPEAPKEEKVEKEIKEVKSKKKKK
jgi:DNA-directed RNA polymerase subunit E'